MAKEWACVKCGFPFELYPPNDTHTQPSLEKEEDSIERTYLCKNTSRSHENKVYWSEPPGPTIT